MEAHQVVPDLLDVASSSVATVKYPSGVEMNQGGELTPTQVKDTPSVSWSDVDPTALYTVLFTDPDAPSRANPAYSEVLHWLVVNVQKADISSGVTIMEYVGSGPPDGTGKCLQCKLWKKTTNELTLVVRSASLRTDHLEAARCTSR